MTNALLHRGPDDEGSWIDRDCGVALGHRRLSILDLSPAGHQPMASASGRYVIVFNGEIYNHLEIRKELDDAGAGTRWRGHSDTETLLAAVERWGVAATLRRSVGMFALALWDRAQRTLVLARDRAGEKPLYYGRQGNTFLFGSELKALRAHRDFKGRIDRAALCLYMRHNYVPDPLSIYEGIRKLPAGHWLEISSDGTFGEPLPYWQASTTVDQGRIHAFSGDDDAAVATLERVLGEAVAGQMVADVPLGAFLSGGVDSSLIVALMQRRSAQRVRTFTIGFDEPEYDESMHARAVAEHLGTDHTELRVSARTAMSVIPQLSTVYDEPFADSSQIPTALVCALARSHVKVCLSGDAGDELFGGYTRYLTAARIWRTLSTIPIALRRGAAAAIRARSPEQWNRFFGRVEPLLPRRARFARYGDQAHKLADLLAVRSPGELYSGLVSHWKDPSAVCRGTVEPQSQLSLLMRGPPILGFQEAMQYWDLMTYLPGDILVKVDRAAMATSLEARVPMLDHRVIEFAWSLPFQMKLRHGVGKWLPRQLLYRYVPSTLIERPKMGFGVPIGEWLRTELRDWAEDLLDGTTLEKEGFFEPTLVRARWDEHLSGRRNWAYSIWNVLMFQDWNRSQVSGARAAGTRVDEVMKQVNSFGRAPVI